LERLKSTESRFLLLATVTPALESVLVERVDGASARISARFYHPELDIVRFFAFLMVFIHHAIPHQPSFWMNLGVTEPIARVVGGIGAMGAFGVDVFFALSSYLITELLLREKEQCGEVDVCAFYLRRMLRIWPLYFAFLAFAASLRWIIPGQHIGWRAGLAFTFLAGNWWIVFQGFPSSIIFPLWSISIEEQFYLTWPAVVRRLSTRAMAAVAVALLAIATLTRIYLGMHHAGETQVWCNTFARLDPIALGVLAAILLRGRTPNLQPFARVALVFTGLLGIALAANYWAIKADPLSTISMVLGYPVAALGSIALVLAVLNSHAMLRKSALVYLGRISYGLYVFHILGLMISDYTVHDQAASLGRYMLRVSVALCTTIALSMASYRWLESPFLQIKQRFTHVLSRPGG
jgi:peptidoglycan/LPS O-acetylase OafA/YrhL